MSSLASPAQCYSPVSHDDWKGEIVLVGEGNETRGDRSERGGGLLVNFHPLNHHHHHLFVLSHLLFAHCALPLPVFHVLFRLRNGVCEALRSTTYLVWDWAVPKTPARLPKKDAAQVGVLRFVDRGILVGLPLGSMQDDGAGWDKNEIQSRLPSPGLLCHLAQEDERREENVDDVLSRLPCFLSPCLTAPSRPCFCFCFLFLLLSPVMSTNKLSSSSI